MFISASRCVLEASIQDKCFPNCVHLSFQVSKAAKFRNTFIRLITLMNFCLPSGTLIRIGLFFLLLHHHSTDSYCTIPERNICFGVTAGVPCKHYVLHQKCLLAAVKCKMSAGLGSIRLLSDLSFCLLDFLRQVLQEKLQRHCLFCFVLIFQAHVARFPHHGPCQAAGGGPWDTVQSVQGFQDADIV